MEIVEELRRIGFREGPLFEWDPDAGSVLYDAQRIDTTNGKMHLLHEVGHALLGHRRVLDEKRYAMERQAWDLARLIAKARGLRVDEKLIVRSLRAIRSSGY